jgi:hypothetical protein
METKYAMVHWKSQQEHWDKVAANYQLSTTAKFKCPKLTSLNEYLWHYWYITECPLWLETNSKKSYSHFFSKCFDLKEQAIVEIIR